MKLIRYHWERPCSIFTSQKRKGIYNQNCEPNENIDDVIEERFKLCEKENIGRKITKIEIYELKEIRENLEN